MRLKRVTGRLALVVAVILSTGLAGLSSASPSEATGCWRQIPGEALDVEIGADGSVWAARVQPGVFGGVPSRWNGSGWTDHPGPIVAFPTGFYGAAGWGLAVGPTGQPWVVTSSFEIWRLVNGAWQRLPGAALSIDVGGDGTVWAVGTNYNLMRWTGSDWSPVSVPGQGVGLIEADHTGALWAQVSGGPPNYPIRLFRRVGDAWQEFPKNPVGGLEMYMDHDMGGDGRNPGRGLLWRTKYSDGQVESFVDGRWVRDPEMRGLGIDVGPDGRPWVTRPGRVGERGTIWARTC